MRKDFVEMEGCQEIIKFDNQTLIQLLGGTGPDNGDDPPVEPPPPGV